MKEIKYTAMPETLRKVADPVRNNVKIFECKDMAEVLKVHEETKLEMIVVNQVKNDLIERHFWIGVRLIFDKNEIRPPELYFAEMTSGQYSHYVDLINKKLINFNPFTI